MSTTLLVLNGSPPSEDLLQWRVRDADFVVAVDGGWYAMRHADLIPDALIGDFDSCPEFDRITSEYPRLKVEFSDDQNTTDFQKAIDWIKSIGKLDKLIILGGLGKRSDHFLSNLITSMKVDVACSVIFDDDHEWIQRVTPRTPLRLSGRCGATISLFALEVCPQVTSSGLRWNLQCEELSPHSGFSQSNLCASDQVEVSCSEGSLFVIVPKGLD